ncbi:molybdopterin-binding protein [Scytonema sp. NUACC26]|uniref:TOBE domain-containing protein n=1 Tax=Scytonema sp. NUACC26 TaxID=3140176 RepID=UPI0034DBD002
MPRKEQGWITFQVSEQERKLLDELSEKLQRTKTEILRELVRGLNQRSWRSPEKQIPTIYVSPQSIPTKQRSFEGANAHSIEITSPKKPLKVSSPNILKGIVTQVIRTGISSQVTLKVVHEVELTSIMTTASADDLELYEGTEVYAVINPCFLILGRE